MRIVADSSCDLNEDLQDRMKVTLVPLTMYLGETAYRDDEHLDVMQMLSDIKSSKEVPRSACPSPEDFIQSFKAQGSVFVVTMTAALSGTFNSAMLAKEIYLQEYGEKFIHVFDSKGSSVCETMIAIKIQECIEKNMTEVELVETVDAYIAEQKYFFQLGSLDNMIKNGRIGRFKGILANALNIKPILFASPVGEVELLENVRTEKKALMRMAEIVGEHCHDFKDKIIGISHCNAEEKAQKLRDEIASRYDFKEIVIVGMRGLSSLYTCEGGITISF